jgi:hypothetical protein
MGSCRGFGSVTGRLLQNPPTELIDGNEPLHEYESLSRRLVKGMSMLMEGLI